MNNWNIQKYRGESIYYAEYPKERFLGFRVNEQITRMLIEPLSVLKISLTLFFTCLLTLVFLNGSVEKAETPFLLFNLTIGFLLFSLFISFGAFCVFLEEFGVGNTLRNSALDMIDAEAESDLIMRMKNQITKGQPLGAGDTGIMSKKEDGQSKRPDENSRLLNHQ